MTHWFDPRLLLRTWLMVLLARVFGRYADRRDAQAARPLDGPFRYDGQPELWLDYVADLGDGWDATTTVASLLAEPVLLTAGRQLPHGRVLVMGGDAVYPAASREEYLRRLEAPYYSVLPYSPDDAPRDLFLLPGNHDWYDGLAAFARLFMQQRWFAGWRTRQSRSYFVLRLPQRWWLIGTDIQLDNDIDAAQLDYLHNATRDIAPGDAVLLATAEPYWLTPADSILRRNIAYLERRLISERGASVRLYLSGDLHHYQRHESEDGAQRVIAGGGGAFLHGTAWQPSTLNEAAPATNSQNPQDTEPVTVATSANRQWQQRALFPSPLAARLSLWRLLLFPLFNSGFALLLGALLTFLLWGIDAASHGLLFGNIAAGAAVGPLLIIEAVPWSPWLLLAIVGWFSAFVASVEIPARASRSWLALLRVPLGMLHGFAHLLVGLTVLVLLMPSRLDNPFAFLGFLLELTLLLAVACGFLFGCWLFVCYQLFGLYQDSAYAAARVPDWKNFLRLHIAADGTLTLYGIGIPRVCRRWRERQPTARGEAFVEPADGISPAQRTQLIDTVVIRR